MQITETSYNQTVTPLATNQTQQPLSSPIGENSFDVLSVYFSRNP